MISTLESVLSPAMKDLADALDDLRSAPYQNMQNVLSRFNSILREEPMAGFIAAVVPRVEFDSWWARMRTTGGSMVGSGSLEWPTDRAERVAMQLELCQAIETGKIEFLQFALQHCYAGSTQLNAQVRHFVQVIMEPMLRDIARLAEHRALPPVLFESMGNLPKSGDVVLDSMLQEACRAFRDPAPAARRLAVERLWDAWERLKSLEEGDNKRVSVDRLLSRAAVESRFRSVLEADARALTEIGNNFHIRHFEQDRSEITRTEHYDYLFHRLYALIHLLLFSRGQDNAA